jgi:hypothetical protein
MIETLDVVDMFLFAERRGIWVQLTQLGGHEGMISLVHFGYSSLVPSLDHNVRLSDGESGKVDLERN